VPEELLGNIVVSLTLVMEGIGLEFRCIFSTSACKIKEDRFYDFQDCPVTVKWPT
jgi:hypothetical protein